MDEPPIVIGQRYNKGTKRQSDGTSRTGSQETEVKGKGNKRQGTDHQRLAKIDRENEVAPPSKIDPAVGKIIQETRQKLGWSRDVFAQKINEKPTVVGDYEGGKAFPNNAILAKMERQLKVKLRGTDIGKPLEGKKKKGEPSKVAEDKSAEDKNEEDNDKNEEGQVDQVEKPESNEPAEASGSGKTKNKKKS